MEIDSKPEALDRLERRIIQLKIEQEALKKEEDEASKKRLATLRETLRGLEKEYADLEEIWKAEKAMLQGAAAVKEELEKVKLEIEAARRGAIWARSRSSSTAAFPSSRSASPRRRRGEQGHAAGAQQGHGRGNRPRCIEVDRHSGVQDARGREGEAPAHGRGARQGVVGQEEAVRIVSNAIRRSRAGLADPRRPNGSFCSLGPPVSARPSCARRWPNFSRQRRGDGAHRHVGIHGEALGRAPDWCATWIRGLRGRRLPDRGGTPPALAVILLDESRRHIRTCYNVLLACSMTGGSPTGRAARSISQQLIIMTSNSRVSVIHELAARATTSA